MVNFIACMPIQRLVALAAVLTINLVPASGPAWAQSGKGNANPGILPPSARSHGMSYGEWSAAWWKWAIEQPTAINPLIDETGINCAVGQTGKVWFLAGTLGSSTPVTRTCHVPTGYSLFFPIANAFFSAEGTYEEMLAAATALVNTATNLNVTIDGKPVQDVHLYRAVAPDFTLDLPADNIFGAPAGAYSPSAADGYYLMLTPLTPGEHTIRIYAEFPGSIVDVTYNLTVGQ